MDSVLVLMSTYNGARYIREQIVSILNQKNVSVNLLIRDDGSKDETIGIINEFAQKYNNISIIQDENLGFVGSFNELIKRALSGGYDYYAFVDQDDIWLEDKLDTAVKQLKGFDNNLPNLYCSNSVLIDVNGNENGLFKNQKPSFTKYNVLLYPIIQGCSMVFNYESVRFYNYQLPKLSYHDRWLFLICNYLGNVFYDHTPRFKYRIHQNNALGVKNNKGLKRILERLKTMVLVKNHSKFYEMTQEFYSSFASLLKDEDKEFIALYLNYKSSASSKLKLLISPEYSPLHKSLSQKLLRAVHILQNRI